MYNDFSMRELYHERNKNRALGALFILLLPMMGLGIERLARAARIDRIIKERGIKNEESGSDVVVICSGKSTETKNDSNHSN